MITPRFSVVQDPDYLTIEINAPFCSLQDLDVDIEDETFMFYCKPYFLRLNLPAKIKDSDTSCRKFDTETQNFTFKIEKYTKSEYFPDLDMLTKLLQPKLCKNIPSCIEVVSNDNESGTEDVQSDSDQWYMNQEIPNDELNCLVLKQGYGFCNKVTSYLNNIQDTLFGVLDDIRVIEMTQEERRQERVQFETNCFDANIYLYQYFNDEDINDIIHFPSPWSKLQSEKLEYTEYEVDILKELPNKEYLLSPKEENQVLIGLVDILFAYCYDKRTFAFENSVESGWATNKISSTLSWFDTFETIQEVIQACFRRSVCFPLHRNFNLLIKVLDDLRLLFKLGQKFVLKCLLEIYQLFNMGSCTDPRYILNELYIKDYCVYIQKCDYMKVNEIVTILDEIEISKEQLNLNLDNIERLAIEEILNSNDDFSTSSNSADSSTCDSDDDSSSTCSDDESNSSVENSVDNLTEDLDYLSIKSDEKSN